MKITLSGVLNLAGSAVAGVAVAGVFAVATQVGSDMMANMMAKRANEQKISKALPRIVASAATNEVLRASLEQKGVRFEFKSDETTGDTNKAWVITSIQDPPIQETSWLEQATNSLACPL